MNKLKHKKKRKKSDVSYENLKFIQRISNIFQNKKAHDEWYEKTSNFILNRIS